MRLDPAPMDAIEDAPNVVNQKREVKAKLDQFLSSTLHSLGSFKAFHV